ncbi:hypothetical protein V6N11_031398 [Hibiscus sabdariffa]|uniref:Uncharacterized protein n=1 Tax=Hibiscus sabdariffa TaxID=183260 RepID=A0ABR2SYA4_9ROSI
MNFCILEVTDRIVHVHAPTPVNHVAPVDLVVSAARPTFVDLLASVDPFVLVDPSVLRDPLVPTDLSSIPGYGLTTPVRGALISSSEPVIGVVDQNLSRLSMHPI